MPKQQHPSHHPVPSQPGAEPSIGVGNSTDPHDRDDHRQGIDEDVGDTIGARRPTDDGLETLPPKSEPI